jgi:hypothetical protein
MPVCAPHVDDVVQVFAGATYLASLDLYSAFFSVPMPQYPPEDGLRVLLVTDRAVFENLRASMGEVNSSAGACRSSCKSRQQGRHIALNRGHAFEREVCRRLVDLLTYSTGPPSTDVYKHRLGLHILQSARPHDVGHWR